MHKKQLLLTQLDASLKRFLPLVEVAPPATGWVRAIRDALGMTARQLAERLGVAQQAVSRIEKQETEGSVTIKTMRRLGECLECDFVYGFVPRTSLENTVAQQARKIARHRLEQATQNMNLEDDQALSLEEKERVISNLAESLIQRLPAKLWDRQG